jgi:hypothetical protein
VTVNVLVLALVVSTLAGPSHVATPLPPASWQENREATACPTGKTCPSVGESMVMLGGVLSGGGAGAVSTVKLLLAAVASVLPAASVARTENV